MTAALLPIWSKHQTTTFNWPENYAANLRAEEILPRGKISSWSEVILNEEIPNAALDAFKFSDNTEDVTIG